MKLLSTEIGEKSIELTFADNPELDDASTLAILRFPAPEMDETMSIAWMRYWALSKLQERIAEQIEADRRVINKGR